MGDGKGMFRKGRLYPTSVPTFEETGSDRLLSRFQLSLVAISAPIILYAGIRGLMNMQHESDLRRESEVKWILEKYDVDRNGALTENEVKKFVEENCVPVPRKRGYFLNHSR